MIKLFQKKFALRRFITPLRGDFFAQAFFEKACVLPVDHAPVTPVDKACVFDKTFFEKVFAQAFLKKACGQGFL
ncbi:hypothetical protein EQO05_11345 [Methanosarcina sp. MSH10X1]|uniref:hypothetical protein n=1 Tax=Methanosarcina sp. MSH10X1 TaxID=2507075 RepID=UPI000FFC3732|nr:hypothetical protein [Methanosarcina sp. MSH10X1]RXA18011.1 hypothetical protein EQO05_11345 [Methanosarcina sp. MSH10X1]